MPHIRIHNATGADLDRVLLYPPRSPQQPVDFGPLAAGEHSAYRELPVLYRYAHIEASGPAGSYVLRPYDYVGEEPLPGGRHTYHLRVDQARLQLELEEGTDEQDE